MAIRTYIKEYYPDETLDVCDKNLKMFFKFMHKRHRIWYRRFVLKLPKEQWTKDPILRCYKYTNIYRELDRGTLWYLDKVASKYEDDTIDFKTLLWWTAMYRLCNRIETFEEVGFPNYTEYDSDELHNSFWEKLHKIEERKQAVMTSAHLTCPTRGGLTKVEGYIEAVNDLHKKLDELCEDIVDCSDLPEIFKCLKRVYCIGSFTAYEIICDLMYVKAIPFTEDDWANVGPGAYQGIRLIFPSYAVGRNKSKRVYERMVHLRDNQHEYFKKFEIEFKFYEKFTKGHLSLRSIEHSLCEFSKYWLQKHNLGKQRMVFQPDTHNTNIKDGDKLIFKD